jgi:demethoxyubiquinone hydroxylase (CLK1/Coq7/Cat5 family)
MPGSMKLSHPALRRLLQRAYSGEKAAALAYIGHAGSLRDPAAKAAVREIEQDEWNHRANVLALMQQYDVPISRWLEFRLYWTGKAIGWACYVIGRFMPYFFAGKLESGNVCEYFVMMRHFRELGIHEHDAMLFEMGIKEKEHEEYFLAQIKDSRWLPWFERVFRWGSKTTTNDVNLAAPMPVAESHRYCRNYKPEEHGNPGESPTTHHPTP